MDQVLCNQLNTFLMKPSRSVILIKPTNQVVEFRLFFHLQGAVLARLENTTQTNTTHPSSVTNQLQLRVLHTRRTLLKRYPDETVLSLVLKMSSEEIIININYFSLYFVPIATFVLSSSVTYILECYENL
jgi:hypothetical protein